MLLRTFDFLYWAIVPRCQYYMLQCTFDFLYLTEGKEKQKNGEHYFYKKTHTHRARRVEEVGLRRFAVQTRQRLGQWPVSRVEVLHRRVGRRDNHWFGFKNENT